jgi:hypothetical protein
MPIDSPQMAVQSLPFTALLFNAAALALIIGLSCDLILASHFKKSPSNDFLAIEWEVIR